MPGFVDTHAHAPQYPNAGTGMDLPLLDWLSKYTFPLETSFSSLDFAEKTYSTVIERLLRCGTTTAVYYATIHPEASKRLAKLALEKGQRAFIGKVNMDRNAPNTYVETTEQSMQDTREFVEYVLNLAQDSPSQSRLITPILTPRFAISCTPELLQFLGELAKNYDIPIQSHLSEHRSEVEFVKKLFPDIESYTAVYDHYGLLDHKTIMAHGIYLTPKERALIKEKKAGVSHCPNSNFTLCSGVCNVRQLLQEGIKVGLGTDISGGFSKSLLNAVRNASVASCVISLTVPNDEGFKQLSLAELIYLATMGGAELVNLENVIGNFVVGKDFDALLVDPLVTNSPFDVFDEIDNVERIFEKFVFLGDERNLKSVYIRGREVSGAESQGNNEALRQLHESVLTNV